MHISIAMPPALYIVPAHRVADGIRANVLAIHTQRYCHLHIRSHDFSCPSRRIMLFMKGNKLFPQCGFSNTAVMILKSITEDFETFDVLSDNEIREGIKAYSNWPTIPQVRMRLAHLEPSSCLHALGPLASCANMRRPVLFSML